MWSSPSLWREGQGYLPTPIPHGVAFSAGEPWHSYLDSGRAKELLAPVPGTFCEDGVTVTGRWGTDWLFIGWKKRDGHPQVWSGITPYMGYPLIEGGIIASAPMWHEHSLYYVKETGEMWDSYYPRYGIARLGGEMLLPPGDGELGLARPWVVGDEMWFSIRRGSDDYSWGYAVREGQKWVRIPQEPPMPGARYAAVHRDWVWFNIDKAGYEGIWIARRGD